MDIGSSGQKRAAGPYFAFFLWVGWGHCRSHHASVRICSTGMASLSSIDSSWFLMLSLLLPSLLIFRIGGVVSPVHSQSNIVVLIILWCMCARAFGSNVVLGHSIMLTSVFSFFLTYCGREEDGWIIRVVHCNMCWWWSVDAVPLWGALVTCVLSYKIMVQICVLFKKKYTQTKEKLYHCPDTIYCW